MRYALYWTFVDVAAVDFGGGRHDAFVVTVLLVALSACNDVSANGPKILQAC